jgi:transcriptional regulator with XRE-family HTH domain
MKVDIGKRIKHWRKERHMTQDALAKKADIPYTTLAKIEAGLVMNPRMDTLIKISTGLGITIDELLITELDTNKKEKH